MSWNGGPLWRSMGPIIAQSVGLPAETPEKIFRKLNTTI